jgi:uncharacterized SAM-binding protein YcdF (DUF218 family)
MREVISFILRPLTIFWILFFVSALSILIRRARSGRLILLLAFIWLAIISTRFIPEMMIRNLEKSYKPLAISDSVHVINPVYIMVLGGGYSDDMSLFPTDRLNLNSLARLVESVRIHNIYPGSKIMAGGYRDKLKTTQSDNMQAAAVLLGCRSDDLIKIRTEINNTNGEAMACAANVTKPSTLILVTDAIHMPRAMMIFRLHGLDLIPAPTNHIIKNSSYHDFFSWLPSVSNIYFLESAVHEYLGILWVKIGGH